MPRCGAAQDDPVDTPHALPRIKRIYLSMRLYCGTGIHQALRRLTRVAPDAGVLSGRGERWPLTAWRSAKRVIPSNGMSERRGALSNDRCSLEHSMRKEGNR